MSGTESKEPSEANSEIKVLVVGDLGVGKSTLISRFIVCFSSFTALYAHPASLSLSLLRGRGRCLCVSCSFLFCFLFFVCSQGESYQESIPKFESKSRKVTKDGKSVKAVLFDSREEERFRTLSSSLYKDAKAVIFVFALDNNTSFESIPKWVEEAKRFCSVRNFVGYIAGTKSDVVDAEEGGDEASEEEPGKVARVDVEKKGKTVPVDEKEVKTFAKTAGMPYMRVTATDFTALKLFNSVMDDVWIRFIDPNAKKSSKKEGGCCIVM